jgi:hypothetical protein
MTDTAAAQRTPAWTGESNGRHSDEDPWAGLDVTAAPPASISDLNELGQTSTWHHVDLHTAHTTVDGPAYLARSDGERLLYAGAIHWISGEPESWKTWCTLLAVRDVLERGERAAFLDFEDTPASFISRLAALGVNALAAYDDNRLRYLSPAEGLAPNRDGSIPRAAVDFVELCDWSPSIAIVDGVTESMGLDGLDPGSNPDVATWGRLIPRPLADTGATVVCIDHVTKSTEGRGRWALGGQHKLAMVDGAAFTIEAIKPVGRPRGTEPAEGLMRLSLAKDKRAHLRGLAGGSTVAAIADMTITAYPDGGVTITLDAPGRGHGDEHQRRIVEHLAIYDGASKTSLRDLGNSTTIDTALHELIKAGHIAVEPSGKTHRHHLTESARIAWAHVIDQDNP